MDKTITAIIPVKGNSSRLPGKNILPFGNSNLLLHKISQLKQVAGITDIIVSSDSEEMLEMARNAGVSAYDRPICYANESVPFGIFLEYLCDTLPNEHILWACVTSPLVEPYLYEKAIRLYFQKIQEGYDSLITVLPCQSYYMDENGPINFKTGLEHKNSEQLQPIYHFTNGINLAPKSKIREWHYNYGPNPYRLEVNKREAADIDDIYDYVCAKAMLNMPGQGVRKLADFEY
ncbi:MAG: acylneuraminate cytidylyltransferase family protein [Bacteroides fragilis]|nr:acylneuraminate cytidylyltransferase family protein [Bacteroides fragilis]